MVNQSPVKRRNPHECAEAKAERTSRLCRLLVATRTNALRQSSRTTKVLPVIVSRNPHECAEAKDYCSANGIVPTSRNPHECAEAKLSADMSIQLCGVATRTNALRQRKCYNAVFCCKPVATRTNALRQRVTIALPSSPTASQPARMR